MKQYFLLIVIAACAISCDKPSQQQYFEQSKEIEIVKKGNEAYFKKDWSTLRSLYADSANIIENEWTPTQIFSIDQYIDMSKEFAEVLTEYRMSDESVYCMVVTNNGEKWVHNWFGFIYKSKDGEEVTIPVSMRIKFVDDKITFQSSYYDQLPLYLAMQSDPKSNDAELQE